MMSSHHIYLPDRANRFIPRIFLFLFFFFLLLLMFQIVYTSVHCYSSRPKKCWASRGEITNPEQIFLLPAMWWFGLPFEGLFKWVPFPMPTFPATESSEWTKHQGGKWQKCGNFSDCVSPCWAEPYQTWAIPNLSHTKPEPWEPPASVGSCSSASFTVRQPQWAAKVDIFYRTLFRS